MRYRYDVALLYLKQSDYNLDEAIEAFRADERWEKENPMGPMMKGKASQSQRRRKFGVSGGITGQVL